MKSKMPNKILLLFLIAVSLSACAMGPWKGRIVDLETKEPLEGAVVLAYWERVYRTPTGPSSYFYSAQEALTDKDGVFFMPVYYPINLLPLISYMYGPTFIIFKPGYLSLMENQAFFTAFSTEKTRELELNQKKYLIGANKLELPRLKTMEERLRNIPGLHSDIPYNKKPFYFKALNDEYTSLGLDPYPNPEGGK